jgi:uncharacterized protein YjhX (UPF0386 family)
MGARRPDPVFTKEATMTTFHKGTRVKSYRNCCHTIFEIVCNHRNGYVTVAAIDSLFGHKVNKHKVLPDVLYPADEPDRFIPLHLPLPSGRF